MSSSSSSSASSVASALVIFSIISILLVLPTGYFLSKSARNAVLQSNDIQFELIRSKQHELLQLIMEAQSILANVEVHVDSELAALDELLEKSESRKDKLLKAESEKQRNVKGLQVLKDDLEPRLGVLEKEARISFKKELEDAKFFESSSSKNEQTKQQKQEDNTRKPEENQQQLDEFGNKKEILPNNLQSSDNNNNINNNINGGGIDHSKRFVVKWHSGTKGVQTSERLRTLQEATIKFDAVGSVAKKLLNLPSSAADTDDDDGGDHARRNSWMVVRQSGGTRWLSCMTNDAVPQPGACAEE